MDWSIAVRRAGLAATPTGNLGPRGIEVDLVWASTGTETRHEPAVGGGSVPVEVPSTHERTATEWFESTAALDEFCAQHNPK